MTVYLRRRVQFTAGIQRGELGGGHNYIVDLTVAGAVSKDTGMVVNIKDIDEILKQQVVSLLDGRILDRDVAAFSHLPPTPENLCAFIWAQVEHLLPSECRLSSVAVWAQLSHNAELRQPIASEDNAMLTVTRTYDFAASHFLHASALSAEENARTFGKCNWPHGHGHNYGVEVTLVGEPDQDTGWLIKPELLDAMVEDEVLGPFDHKHLNLDVPEFRERNPTSENVAVVVWERMARRLEREPGIRARLYRIIVRETDRNYFEYYGQ